MEDSQKEQEEAVNQLYAYAANLLLEQEKTPAQTIKALIDQGLDEKTVRVVVENLQIQIQDAKKEAGKKDMLYGALWCVGGTVATWADIGFIFWGAIVFGGYQFIRGAMNAYA